MDGDDGVVRRMKKRDRRQFEDWEAEEKSDDSDIEREMQAAKRPEILPPEVRELQREMDARMAARDGKGSGVAHFDSFLDDLERRAKEDEIQAQDRLLHQQQQQQQRAELGDDDDLLIPENELGRRHETMSMKRTRMMEGDEVSLLAPSSFRDPDMKAKPRIHAQIDSAHKTLPSASDPRLWMVKCYKTGLEQQFCANLINKFHFMVQKEGPEYLNKVPIYSVFAADAAKGYVWIEAHREIDVREYIKGIRGLGAWNVHLVPTNEMIGVFNYATFIENEEKNAIKPNSWVRIKRGIYKNDIGVVMAVKENAVRVRIKPRTNFDGNAGVKIPRQDFLTLENAKDLNLPVVGNGKIENGFATFEVNGEVYTSKSGHLLKTIPKSGITTNITTSLAEEEAFSNPNAAESYALTKAGTGDPEADARQQYRQSKNTQRGGAKQKQFFPLERVRIRSGQLTNLLCRVVEVLPKNILKLEAEFAGEEWKRIHGIDSGLMELPIEMVEKYFEIGDRVKAVDGENRGETGMVVKVEEKERCCIIVSDSREERGFPIEFRVSTWDLTVSNEKKESELTNYGFQVGDLCHGPSKQIGIITALGRSTAKILMETGQTTDWSYKQMSLWKKYRTKAPFANERENEWALDRRGQKICRTHLVLVYATQKRRRMVGTVVHILRESASGQERVFVHDMETLGEEKFVVALARECESRTPIQDQPPPKKHEDGKLAIGDGSGNDSQLLPIQLPDRKLLRKGRRVVILSGAYKTQLAEIREEIDEEYVRVQLLTKPKMMQLHKKQIAFHDMPKKSKLNMLEDLPPTVPATPIYEIEEGSPRSQMNEIEDDLASNGADPWDIRFKLPAPIRKKAEAAWDPTYRKPKNALSVKDVTSMANPQTTIEDARSIGSGREGWNTPHAAKSDADNRSQGARSNPERLLELMDEDGTDGVKPMDVDEDDEPLVQTPQAHPPSPQASVRSRRSARTLTPGGSSLLDSQAGKSMNSSNTTSTTHGNIPLANASTPEENGNGGLIINRSSPSADRMVPQWCQKGVKVQVDGKLGHVSIVLFANLFVIFEDRTTEKYSHDKIKLAPISIGDTVLCFGDFKYLNKVGTCKSIDTTASTAAVDFKKEGVVILNCDMLASYKYKSHILEDDAATADDWSETQSNASGRTGKSSQNIKNIESPAAITVRPASPLSQLEQSRKSPSIPGSPAPDATTQQPPERENNLDDTTVTTDAVE